MTIRQVGCCRSCVHAAEAGADLLLNPPSAMQGQRCHDALPWRQLPDALIRSFSRCRASPCAKWAVYLCIFPKSIGKTHICLDRECPTATVMKFMITGRQIQAARALLGWSQEELAERAKIARNTLYNLESGIVDPRTSTVEAVRRTLERAGIEFVTDAISEGVRLIKPRSGNKEPSTTAAPKKR